MVISKNPTFGWNLPPSLSLSLFSKFSLSLFISISISIYPASFVPTLIPEQCKLYAPALKGHTQSEDVPWDRTSISLSLSQRPSIPLYFFCFLNLSLILFPIIFLQFNIRSLWWINVWRIYHWVDNRLKVFTLTNERQSQCGRERERVLISIVQYGHAHFIKVKRAKYRHCSQDPWRRYWCRLWTAGRWRHRQNQTYHEKTDARGGDFRQNALRKSSPLLQHVMNKHMKEHIVCSPLITGARDIRGSWRHAR